MVAEEAICYRISLQKRWILSCCLQLVCDESGKTCDYNAVTLRPCENPIRGWFSRMRCCCPMWIGIVWVIPQTSRVRFPGQGNDILFAAHTLDWICISRGSLPAGTVVQWRWSSLPGSSGGIRRWAAPRAPYASRSASARAGIRGTRRDRASCTRAPPGPAPPGSPYLSRGDTSNRVDVGQNVSDVMQKVAWDIWTRKRMWAVSREEQPKCCYVPFDERAL